MLWITDGDHRLNTCCSIALILFLLVGNACNYSIQKWNTTTDNQNDTLTNYVSSWKWISPKDHSLFN